MPKPVRPKEYDRPGYRETGPKRRELDRIAEQEIEEEYNIFDQLTREERRALDPTLSYCHGWQDARDGRPIRGNSPEYEDGYLAGQKVRGETVQ